jgi:hypothetical protein
MKAEQLKELGFKLVKEYVHGDNDEFITQVFRKNNLIIDLDFDKKTGKLLCTDTQINDYGDLVNLKIVELKQLDKILNK